MDENKTNPAERESRSGLIKKFEDVGYVCQMQAQLEYTVMVFRPRGEKKEEEAGSTGLSMGS